MEPDPIEALKRTVQDLTYPSESDEPFDVIAWVDPGTADVARVVEERVRKNRKIRKVPVEEFFAALREADDAERYNALRQTLESLIKQLQIFRIGQGEVRVDVYLLGLEKGGARIIGLHTISVET